MKYEEWPVPLSLRPWVRCVWGLEAPAGPGAGASQPIVPDGCSELVINLADPFLREGPTGEFDAQPLIMHVGQITGPLRVAPSGSCRLVGIRLQPWSGAALTGVPATEFRDRYVAWGDIPLRPRSGPLGDPGVLEALADRLRARAFESWGPIAIRWMTTLERVGAGPDPGRMSLARAVVDRIEATAGVVGVRGIARSLHTTERSVQRAMREEVGLSPTTLGRILRFQKALTGLLTNPERARGEVALAAGYYDQPHFNREFRRLTGTSPALFLGADRSLTDHFLSD